jgi:RimJ/RimL family protein N-acetyltransferase
MPPLVAPRLVDGPIVVRGRRLEDVDAVTAICQDPDVQRWTVVPSPYTRADALAFHSVAAQQAHEGTALHLLIEVDGVVGGSIGFLGLHRPPGAAEIGYAAAPWARGRGVVTRAVVLLRDWMAAELGVRRIVAHVHRDNVPSQRVPERAGFRSSGELVKVPRAGSTEPDHLVYAWTSDA